MQVISRNTADAESRQTAAVEKEEALQKESAVIAVEKADAEQALSEAIPALEEAAAALNDLKRDDITEIRSFAKPHILVQKVRLQCTACKWVLLKLPTVNTDIVNTDTLLHFSTVA